MTRVAFPPQRVMRGPQLGMLPAERLQLCPQLRLARAARSGVGFQIGDPGALKLPAVEGLVELALLLLVSQLPLLERLQRAALERANALVRLFGGGGGGGGW